MHRVLIENREMLTELCERYGVRSLEVFGSAATGSFNEASSDIDLLVRFDPGHPMTGLKQFFGFKESVESLLGHAVDLVNPDSMRNPYFKREVENQRRPLYAA